MYMEIGDRLRNLRIQRDLTQEELGERTDLTKGYISQLERNLSSPSMETFFTILEVLGVSPEEFFNEQTMEQKIVYQDKDNTHYYDEENGYELRWLVPGSNEKEMDPVLITFIKNGEYKTFEPSLSETFVYVLEGSITLLLGDIQYRAKKGETLYYHATSAHQLKNCSKGKSRILVVATASYL